MAAYAHHCVVQPAQAPQAGLGEELSGLPAALLMDAHIHHGGAIAQPVGPDAQLLLAGQHVPQKDSKRALVQGELQKTPSFLY